jgi:predicted kinase
MIKIQLHTIILLIGPSSSGKSHFAQNILIPQLQQSQLQNIKLKIAHLSSDDIRRDLLQSPDEDKFSKKMMSVSKQAFDLLKSKLEAVTSYPVNNEFVIVDSKGISPEFRQEIINIAKKKNYNLIAIVFDYKDREDYLQYVKVDLKTDLNTKKFISNDIDKLKKEVLRDLSKNTYNQVIRFKKKSDVDGFVVQISDLELYNDCYLTGNSEDYVITSDLHGGLTEFKNLRQQKDLVNKKWIIAGDYIDKGFEIQEIIEYLYDQKDNMLIVSGNHENYVYKALTGGLTQDTRKQNKDLEKDVFNSISLLENNPELKNKFIEIFEDYTLPFVANDSFVVTHAPCKNIYLGKLDTKSQKEQRNFRYSKREDYSSAEEYEKALESELQFIPSETQSCYPYHVFGHIPMTQSRVSKNHIAIDQGGVCGGKYTAITIKDRYIKFYSTTTKNPYKAEYVPTIFSKKASSESPHNIDFDKLDISELRRIKKLLTNKVNFISGTIAPADKFDNELESLKQGLLYYKNQSINQVVLQPKYMGSRCQIYLFKDLEKCYATSRNGYLIKKEELQKVYVQLQSKFCNLDFEMIILDGELLPWSLVGKNLIEKQFLTIKKAIETKKDFYEKNNFHLSLFNVENYSKQTNFNTLRNTQNKVELEKELGSNIVETLQNYSHFQSEYIPITDQQIAVYSHQLDLFAKPVTNVDQIVFKPFCILKMIDSKQENNYISEKMSNYDLFKTVSNDKIELIDFSDDNYLDKAKKYWNETVESQEEMEGIVIKPLQVYTKSVAPAIKVRNKRYLSIIYGHNYLEESKYKKLINKKSIRKKLKVSIQEWEIAKKLLDEPHNSINSTNEKYKQILGQMIMEEQEEIHIDPRL